MVKAVESLWIPWEHARLFSGRSWLFERISAWLESPVRRMAIVGLPGSGKSAIAVQVARSSLKAFDTSYAGLPKGWLAAMHFCDSYRSETLDPALFVRSLIHQFSDAVPGFAEASQKAALELTGTPINVSATVTAGTVHPGAKVVGAEIEIHGYTPGEMASRILGEALRSLDLPSRPVVLVDGVDEAAAFPTETTLTDLLTGPTFQDLPIRLLVTTRPAGFQPPLGSCVIDLDTETDNSVADVRGYALQRLRPRVPGRYRGSVSDSVSTASGGNFLYAHHVIEALLATEPSGTPLPIWTAPQLPSDLAEVYDGFRRRSIATTGSEEKKRHWRTVLRPVLALLAVAQGDGLTRSQLQMMAELDGDAVNDALDDLRQFLQLGDTEAPIRIFHNSFREYLASGHTAEPPIIDADAAHSRIATGALRRVRADPRAPYAGWDHADGYTKRNLSVHARHAGLLPELLRDIGFVTFAEPYGLLSAIESLDELPAEALAYRQVFPELLVVRDVGLRLSYLGLAYQAYSLDEQIRRLAEFPAVGPWVCRWARTRPSRHRRILSGHEHGVTAVAATQLAGKLVVVSGDDAGHIIVWDAVSGTLLRRCQGHQAAIVGLVVAQLGPGQVLISGAEDCTLRKWDLETLQPLGVFSTDLDEPGEGPRESLVTSDGGRHNLLIKDGMTSEAEGPIAHRFGMSSVRGVPMGDRQLVVTGGKDAAVRVWDAESATVLCTFDGYPQAIGALDAAAIGDAVLVAAASHLDVGVWEIGSGRGYLVSRDFRFNVRTLAFVRIGEDLFLLTPGRNTEASLWNALTGELVRELPTPSRVSLLAGTCEPGRSPLIAALVDGRIRVWTDEPGSWQDLYGHNCEIRALAAAEADGHSVILSGGTDRSVRVWDPPRHPKPPGIETTTHVWTLRTADVEGRAAMVASSLIGSVSVYDMASGAELFRFRGHPEEVYKSCLTAVGEGHALVAAGDDGLVRVWDVRSGALIHRFGGRRSRNRPLDLAHCGGQAIAFFITGAGVNGADLNSGAIVHEFKAPTSRFTSISAVSTSTDTFVVLLDRATLVLWSATGQSLIQVDACTLPATSLTAISHGDHLVIVLGYPDGHIEAWNQTTGRHTVLTGHAVEMTCMSAAFAGPDLVVATSAGARDVHVTALGLTHEIRLAGDVRDLAVHPSGVVVVGTTDGVTCIDPTASARNTAPVASAKRDTRPAVVELQASSPCGDDARLFDPAASNLIDEIVEDYGHTASFTGPLHVLGQRDLDEAIERYGPRHLEVARALMRLSHQLAAEGMAAEALAALENVLSMADEIALPTVDLAEVLGSTARLYRRDGSLDAALTALRQLASIYEDGPAHAALLGETLTRIAEVLIEAKRPKEARTTMPRALAALARAHGENHQALNESLHRAASACFYSGDIAGAIDYIRQALALGDRRAPNGDRHTRESLLFLAWLLQRTEADDTADDEALTLLSRALEVSRHVHGANSEQVANVLGLLAHLWSRTESPDQAIALLKQSIAIDADGELATTAATVNRLSLLFSLLLEHGHHEQAPEVGQRLVTASEAVHGTESVEAAVAHNSHGVALMHVGELEESRASLEHATSLLQQSPDGSEQMRQTVAHNLAAVIELLGTADDEQTPEQPRDAQARDEPGTDR